MLRNKLHGSDAQFGHY